MRNRLLPVAGVLVFVSAAIHLALGVTGLAEAFSTPQSALLPALYLLGGLAALALLGVIALTPAATTAYAAGVGLMVLFLLAYADVHGFGVAESTLGIETGHDHGAGTHSHDSGRGHDHGTGDHGHSHEGHDHNGHDRSDGNDDTLSTLADHLRGDAYALVSKAAEAGAAVLFTALLSLDR
ncbi:hypothetical protein [Halalkalicoccus sp. NIPERK01]|uniref:hypothetical protein n=1 Tax=Halalkalicoccus sp. NIPERK01 TaxID=3053469 RepID=UPI00256EB3F9|nr:hypothetical protein [Halalkalicoccus sp. NIPERK01]MDL5362269.1 hypothetical protein [Halalkalicoccus sp. NIPERK01]